MEPQRTAKDHTHMLKIPVFKATLFLCVIIFMECDKSRNGQTAIDTFMDSFFYFVMFITSGSLRNLIGYLILVFDIFETCCYRYSHAGINAQIIMVFDFGFIWKNMKILLFLIPFVAFLLLLAMYAKIMDTVEINIPHPYTFWKILLLITPLFDILYRLNLNLNGHNEILLNKTGSYLSIFSFFTQKHVTAEHKKSGVPKNLIIFEIESMELQVLGRFNPTIPDSMPFISKLTKNSTFFSRMVPQEYTTWSVASTFAFQCGMPMIIPYTNMNGNRLKIHWSDIHHCIGDYLHTAGYKLYSMMTKQFIGGFRKMLELHHWIAQDQNEHKFDHDYDVLDIIMDDMFPLLANESLGPYAIHIATTDTHPIFPELHQKCKFRVSPNSTKIIQEFDCYDQALEEFFTRFEKLDLHKNTAVVLYGDHPMMWPDDLKVQDPRYLPVIIPYREVKEIDREISLYDLSHTIFDLLDLDVTPKFPFGASLVGNTTGSPPTSDDFKILFHFFKSSFQVENREQKVIDSFVK